MQAEIIIVLYMPDVHPTTLQVILLSISQFPMLNRMLCEIFVYI